jgi:hypothetical protein
MRFGDFLCYPVTWMHSFGRCLFGDITLPKVHPFFNPSSLKSQTPGEKSKRFGEFLPYEGKNSPFFLTPLPIFGRGRG